MSDIKIIECETTGSLMDIVKAKAQHRKEVGYVKGNLIAFVSEEFAQEIERCIGIVIESKHTFPEEFKFLNVYYAGHLYNVDVYGKKELANNVIQIFNPSVSGDFEKVFVKDFKGE